MIRMWVPVMGWGLRLLRRPRRLWHTQFHDARIILEQNGDLKYFAIPARLQQLALRASMVSVVLMAGMVFTLGATSLTLHVGKSRLEESHQRVYQALLGSTADLGLNVDEEMLDSERMALLAEAIRERDLEIRRYVVDAAGSLEASNSRLQANLDATGLTEKAIRVIQTSSAMGGDAYKPERNDPLIQGALQDTSARHRELKDVLLALPSTMPLKQYDITSGFGIRKHPISGQPRFHAGIDLTSDHSDDVYPVKPGKVVLARNYQNYGNTVIIQHARGVETLYAHLHRIDVKEGQEVDTETVIGLVGNTGASTGKHLHFEVSVGGYPVDPEKVIKTASYVRQTQELALRK
jgi:murein DD-endopeptidase MepM/ murein hydrolase activator NlpD